MTKFFLTAFIILLLFSGCPDTGVQPKPNTLLFVVEDVTCTEVFLKLSLDPSEKQRTVTLLRNDSTVATITMVSTDSLFVDEGLLPNKAYAYTLSNGSWKVTALATTMDTTSHNWSWEIDTLGIAYSMLYDVAIINDTLAYAVGQIYVKDSTGQFDPQPYNLAIWNGQSWKLQKLFANGFPPAINSVFAVSAFDVWFSPWFHWDGRNFQEIPSDPIFFGIGINKIWGDSNGIYVVGTNGFIAHRSANGTWTKIESGTDLDFQDIYGSGDEVLAVCTSNYPLGRGIYRIQENTATEISSYPIGYQLFGVWFHQNRHYYVVGDGIYEKRFLSDNAWNNGPLDVTKYETKKMRGNGVNDAVVVGAFGECLHWNGKNWKSNRDQTAITDGEYESVAIKNNLVIAVGWYGSNGKAVVAIGKR